MAFTEYEKNHYLWQRKVLGVLVFLLPILSVAFTFFNPENVPMSRFSISDTYYTNARGVMISIIAISSFFFLTYNPYKCWVDSLANWMSGISLLSIIVFPCYPDWNVADKTNMFMIPIDICGTLHRIFAIGIFLGFFINIVFCFTKGGKEGKKKIRNIIYYIAGGFIVIATALLIACLLGLLKIPNFVWLSETIAMLPMGIAWLVKAETFKFLND